MNKKGQGLKISSLLLGVLIGIIIMLFLLYSGVITGSATSGSCNCELISRKAKYEIVGKSSFEGRGLVDGKFEIELKNEEDQATKFKINMLCNTAKKPSSMVSSEFIYVQPRSIEKFLIKYPVGFLEDWTCVLSSVNSETIDSCDVV